MCVCVCVCVWVAVWGVMLFWVSVSVGGVLVYMGLCVTHSRLCLLAVCLYGCLSACLSACLSVFLLFLMPGFPCCVDASQKTYTFHLSAHIAAQQMLNLILLASDGEAEEEADK